MVIVWQGILEEEITKHKRGDTYGTGQRPLQKKKLNFIHSKVPGLSFHPSGATAVKPAEWYGEWNRTTYTTGSLRKSWRTSFVVPLGKGKSPLTYIKTSKPPPIQRTSKNRMWRTRNNNYSIWQRAGTSWKIISPGMFGENGLTFTLYREECETFFPLFLEGHTMLFRNTWLFRTL